MHDIAYGLAMPIIVNENNHSYIHSAAWSMHYIIIMKCTAHDFRACVYVCLDLYACRVMTIATSLSIGCRSVL